jgi:hypothetical protein
LLITERRIIEIPDPTGDASMMRFICSQGDILVDHQVAGLEAGRVLLVDVTQAAAKSAA